MGSDEYPFLEKLRPEQRADRYTFGADDPDVRQTLVVEGDDAGILGFVMFGVSRDHDLPEDGEIYALYVNPDH